MILENFFDIIGFIIMLLNKFYIKIFYIRLECYFTIIYKFKYSDLYTLVKNYQKIKKTQFLIILCLVIFKNSKLIFSFSKKINNRPAFIKDCLDL